MKHVEIQRSVRLILRTGYNREKMIDLQPINHVYIGPQTFKLERQVVPNKSSAANEHDAFSCQ